MPAGWSSRPTRPPRAPTPTLLQEITGEPATVVLSDEKEASDRIDAFAKSEPRWMVAVRMVSEGVDVPAARGRGLRDQRLHAAVLRAGDRPVRAGPAPRRDGIGVPAERAGADWRWPNALELERDHALDRRTDEDDEGDLWNPEDAMVADANRAGEGVGGR